MSETALKATPSSQPAPATGGRRWLALVAIAAGGAVLAASVLLPTFVADRLVKLPARMRQTVVAEGTGSMVDMQLLVEQGKLRTDHDVPIRVVNYMTSIAPTNSDIITLQVACTTRRQDRPGYVGLLDAFVDRVSLNRVTGAPVTRLPASTFFEYGLPPNFTRRVGFQYKFPFDMTKRNHPYFDVIAQQETTLQYVDDDTVRDGMRLLHFRNTVEPVSLEPLLPLRGRVTLSLETLGRSDLAEPPVLTMFYSANRDLWIDPATGILIAMQEHQSRFLAPAAGDQAPVQLLDADMHLDARSSEDMIEAARTARDQIALLRREAPITLAVAGMTVLALGIWRLRKSG